MARTFDTMRIRDVVNRLDELFPADVHGLDLELSTDLPIVLLPVRLEACFSTARPEVGRLLRVRIIPDDIHVPTLEDGITDHEAALANRYRDAVAADGAGAWQDLVAGVGSTTPRVLRAAWLADRAAKGPVTAQPATPLTVRGLPDRWFVSAYNGDRVVASATTKNVRPDLTVDPGSRAEEATWLTEFTAAIAAGMGLEIQVDEVEIDVLLAVGVRGGNDGARDAHELAALLEAHRFSRGVDLLRPGTPTNNTPPKRAAWSSVPDVDEIRRRTTDPPAGVADATNGRELTSALGLPPDTGALSRPRAAGETDQAAAAAMIDLLWPVTGGELLAVMMSDRAVGGKGIDQSLMDEVRDHASRYVRGRGPLPTVLVGRQPYGVLPASCLSRWATGDDGVVMEGLRQRLLTGWAVWELDASSLTRLGGAGDDGKATELIARLMCQSPVPDASGYQATTIFPPNFSRTMPFLPTDGPLDADLATGMLQVPWTPLLADSSEDADKIGTVVLPAVAPEGGNRLASLWTGDEHRLLLRLVQAGGAKGDLLCQLAQRALLRSAERAASYVSQQIAVKLRRPQAALQVAASMVNDLGAVSPKNALEFTLGEVFSDTPAGAADITLSDLVTRPELVGDIFPALRFEVPPSSPEHDAAVQAIERLKGLENDDLERLMGETLDLFTNRYDAWVTSLATRRLRDLRATNPDGIHLGGFGWLVDLQDAAAPTGADFVHAPSPAQAATGAVLRHADIDDRAASLDHSGTARRFDVTSASVRVARGILDAVRQGQPLSAVLGYRIERFLQDGELSEHIADLRGDHGMFGGEPLDPLRPGETVPAHDVVDGVAVWRAITQPSTDRDHQVAAIAGLAEHLAFIGDALSDLLVAEGVHQLVTGDHTRASATLTALSRGVPPPAQLRVVDSPGRHIAVPVQLLMAVDDRAEPAAQGWTNDRPRVTVAPAAERLARALLPEPAECGFLVAHTESGQSRIEQAMVGLDELGLCALDVLAEAGADDDHSALASRIRFHLGHGGTLLPEPPAGKTVGWGALTALARSWARVFGSSRPLLHSDVLIGPDEGAPEPPPPSAVAVTAAEQALAGAVGTIVEAKRALERTLADLGPAAPDAGFVAAVVAPLERFRAAGLAGTAQEPADDPAVTLGLVRRCVAAGVAAELRIGQLAATLDNDHPLIAQRPGASNLNERTEKLAAACRDIFGTVVVAAPAIRAPDIARRTVDAADSLPGSDELADWLGELSEVRAPTRRVWQALLATETLTGKSPTLVPSQFPTADGKGPIEGWIGGWAGQRVDWKPPLHARRAFMTLSPEDTRGPGVAALVVDSWVERVPVGFEHEPHRDAADELPPEAHWEPTGVAVHFNAASARPPQSIVLAVPPDRSTPTWHLGDLIATLLETLELSRFRGVEPPADLPSRTVLPAVFVPEGIEGLSFVSTLFQTLHAGRLTAEAMHIRRFGDA